MTSPVNNVPRTNEVIERLRVNRTRLAEAIDANTAAGIAPTPGETARLAELDRIIAELAEAKRQIAETF